MGAYVPFWDPDNAEAYFEAFDAADWSPWDLGYLDGVLIPGRVTLTGGESTRKIDVQNGPGIEGATMKFQSLDPAPVDILVTIWTAEQWSQWQAFRDSFQPQPGKKPPSVRAFYHPQAASIGVQQIVVETISIAKPGSVRGTVETSIKARQYFKPKKAQILPAVSIRANTVAPTQNDSPGSKGP